jgi:type III pantothenate kinase
VTGAEDTLLLDAGNTRLKWAITRGDCLLMGEPVVYCQPDWTEQLDAFWQELPANVAPTRALLAGVAGSDVTAALVQQVKTRWEVTIQNVISSAHDCGVRNAYAHPERLGADRWAALVAARHYCDGPTCIIDCGTTLTVDLLDADGVHRGGIIAPGLNMMRAGLRSGTAGLSKATLPPTGLLANDTGSAMAAGVHAAAAGVVEGMTRRCHALTGLVLHRIITGGDALAVLPWLEGNFRHQPHWVLKGLAVIAAATTETREDDT